MNKCTHLLKMTAFSHLWGFCTNYVLHTIQQNEQLLFNRLCIPCPVFLLLVRFVCFRNHHAYPYVISFHSPPSLRASHHDQSVYSSSGFQAPESVFGEWKLLSNAMHCVNTSGSSFALHWFIQAIFSAVLHFSSDAYERLCNSQPSNASNSFIIIFIAASISALEYIEDVP